MAKAKKSESAATPAGGKKKADRAKPPVASQGPAIDTGLAAESAAKRVAAGFGVIGAVSASSGAPAHESTSFKSFKENINKPASAGLASILDKTAGPGQKKPNLPYQSGKQVGRNQVFGADVNRTGVPRRTGGG